MLDLKKETNNTIVFENILEPLRSYYLLIDINIFFLTDSGQVNVSIAHCNDKFEQSGLLAFIVNIYAKICKICHGPLRTRRLIDTSIATSVFIVMIHLVNGCCPH